MDFLARKVAFGVNFEGKGQVVVEVEMLGDAANAPCDSVSRPITDQPALELDWRITMCESHFLSSILIAIIGSSRTC